MSEPGAPVQPAGRGTLPPGDALSRRRSPVTHLERGEPRFSVIVPTYQRRTSLRRVLAGLAAQEWPAGGLEVLVVSDGGTDGSAEMARSFPLPARLRVLEQPNRGPAAARNLGLAHAAGTIVLFLDDDVVPGPRLVAEHDRSHREAPDRVVIGPMLEPSGRLLPWVRWESRRLAEQYAAMVAGEWPPTPWQFYTGNASVHREHLRAVGGFDTGYRRAEDIEVAFRLQGLGLEFVFNPAAAGVHIAERSYRSWLDAGYQYGRNDVAFGKIDERVVAEFPERHPLTRWLVRWGLRSRPAAERLVVRAELAIRAAETLRLRSPALQLCGAVFNLQYWLGVADELGSTRSALELTELALGLKSRTRSRLPIGPRTGRT